MFKITSVRSGSVDLPQNQTKWKWEENILILNKNEIFLSRNSALGILASLIVQITNSQFIWTLVPGYFYYATVLPWNGFETQLHNS